MMARNYDLLLFRINLILYYSHFSGRLHVFLHDHTTNAVLKVEKILFCC